MSFKKNLARSLAAAATIGAMGLGGLIVAAPASAADGDRLQGPLVGMYNGTYSWSTSSDTLAAKTGKTAAVLAALDAGEMVSFTYPAAGAQGPIVVDSNGLCVVATEKMNDGILKLAECDASNPLQQFRGKSEGKGLFNLYSVPTGLFVQVGSSGPRMYSRTASGGNQMHIQTEISGRTIVSPAPVEAPLVVTNPANGSTVGTAGVEFAGTGEPGTKVDITDKSGKVIGTTTVKPDGSWSVTVPSLPAGSAPLTVTAGDASVTVDVTIAEAPLVVTKPAGGSTVGTEGVEFAGTGEPGTKVDITDKSGKVIGTTTVKPDGSWSVTVPSLPEGSAPLSVTAGDKTVTVDVDIQAPVAPPSADLVVTSPADGEVVGTSGVTFEGTGEPGTVVEITDADGNVLGSTTIGADGAWSVPVSELPEGASKITVTAGDTSVTVNVVATIDSEDTPIMALAGVGALGLLAAGGAGFAVRRRRTADAA